MKPLKINVEFELGQAVWLKTDTEQLERIVTQLIICEGGVMYELSCGEDSSAHWGFEITDSEDTLKRVK